VLGKALELATVVGVGSLLSVIADNYRAPAFREMQKGGRPEIY